MNKLWNLAFGKNDSVRHARNYMMGQIINKGLNFFLMPITTALMTPFEYGTNSVFQSLVSIFVILLPLCLYRGVTRFHYDEQYDNKEVLGTQFSMMMTSMTIVSAFLLVTIALWNTLTGLTIFLTILMMFHSYFQSIINFYMAYLQARRQSSKYAFINVLLGFFTTIGGIFWMSQLNTNVFLGLIYSNLIGRFLLSIYSIYDMRHDLVFVNSKKMQADIWRYCLPLLPHMISGVILNYMDRFMISQMVGMTEAGLYSFAYNFGFIVNVVVYAINQTWGPEFFQLMNKKDYKTIGSRIMNYQNALLTITTLIVFFNKEVTLILANKRYHNGYGIIPVICYGYVLFHLYSTLSNYGSYYKKTGFMAIVSGIAALFNIITNYFGIKYFGYQAAAVTTAISYLLQYFLYYYGNKYFIKEEMHDLNYFLIKTLTFCVGTFAIIALIHATITTMWLSIVIKGICSLLVIYLIWKGSDDYVLHS